MKLGSKYFGAVLIVLGITAALSLGVWSVIDKTVNSVIEREAEISAKHWVKYFYNNVEGMENLIKSGSPDDAQEKVIAAAVNFGEVFRFKLFRTDGTVALVSDEYKYSQEGLTEDFVNPKVLAVIQTGVSDISTHDGSQKENRPNLYVEAYVPTTDSTGQIIGVIEVYVDQTESAGILHSGFDWLALFLPALCGVIYITPSIAFLRKGAVANVAKAKAERLSKFDVLTGLHNRRSFKEEVQMHFEQAKSIGMIFIDVDDFKQLNDEFGHEGGDEFLRAMADNLTKILGDQGIISRFGGDEFVACLPNVSETRLNNVANSIVKAAGIGVLHRDNTIFGRVSVGTHLAHQGEKLEDVLHAADIALYKSKEAGKNIATSYTSEMNDDLLRRQKLEQLLRKSIHGDGLELNYQPINDPVSGNILGFEALLRLRDENDAIISPIEFIPLAEKLGLIIDIGKWVLEEAIQNAKDWPEHMFVSVNLSPIQFKPDDLPGFLFDVLRRNDFPANRLEVEVTESLLVGNNENVEGQLKAIKAMGISIAMDDFGTGYSSLGYLWKYEFDKLKIDRSFILGYDKQPEKLVEIIETIVMLGHKAGMTVAAEGVENSTHQEMLINLDCDQLQGYLFGKPMPATEAAIMIAKDTLRKIDTGSPAPQASKENVA